MSSSPCFFAPSEQTDFIHPLRHSSAVTPAGALTSVPPPVRSHRSLPVALPTHSCPMLSGVQALAGFFSVPGSSLWVRGRGLQAGPALLAAASLACSRSFLVRVRTLPCCHRQEAFSSLLSGAVACCHPHAFSVSGSMSFVMQKLGLLSKQWKPALTNCLCGSLGQCAWLIAASKNRNTGRAGCLAGSGLRASRQPSGYPTRQVCLGFRGQHWGRGGGPQGPRPPVPEELPAHRLGVGVRQMAMRVEGAVLSGADQEGSWEKQRVRGGQEQGQNFVCGKRREAFSEEMAA